MFILVALIYYSVDGRSQISCVGECFQVDELVRDKNKAAVQIMCGKIVHRRAQIDRSQRKQLEKTFKIPAQGRTDQRRRTLWQTLDGEAGGNVHEPRAHAPVCCRG